MQYSRPPRTSSLEALALLAEGEPTELLPVVRVARSTTPVSPRNTEPILLPANSFDEVGRFYLSCSDKWNGDWYENKTIWDDTLYHIDRLIKEYHDLTGYYPDEICLSFDRYLVRAKGLVYKYWPRDMRAKPIPFVCEANNVGCYEVLVRGAIRK